jgi:hypothetical protein
MKRLRECGEESLCLRIGWGLRHEYADPPHPVWLLRTRVERPRRRRATEQRDKFSPPHRLYPRPRITNQV